MKYQFPTGYGDMCVLVPIDAALVPLVSGALKQFELRGYWQTDADFEAGYNAFAGIQAAMANNCLVELVESNNRLYRLLDTALNGTVYTSNGTEISPELPAVPPASTGEPNAMRAHLGRLHQLAENAATGAAYAADSGIDGSPELDYNGSWRARLEAVQGLFGGGWFGIGSRPATIADLAQAMKGATDQDAERVLGVLDALGAGGSAATIFGTIKGLFMDGEELVTDGAVLGTLIATAIAQAAMLGTLAGQLDRLTAALDGGGLVAATPPPAGSVLGELETIKVQLQ